MDKIINVVSFEKPASGDRHLGKAPSRNHLKMLQLSDFLRTDPKLPAATNFWPKRVKFPLRTFGNTEHGCCTIASQALLTMRMERLEQRRTISAKTLTDKSILDVYYALTQRMYGGGDTGAYELDALNNWRREDLTFKDTKDRPFTIDAFTRINQYRIEEVKAALWVAQAHGIKVCFNLPWAWAYRTDGVWDIPEGQQPIGNYLPGSWGGHSMTAVDYDENWVYMPSSWGEPDTKISWRAFAIYCDEAYLVVDSINAWKKKRPVAKAIDLTNLKSAVNSVSSVQIGK